MSVKYVVFYRVKKCTLGGARTHDHKIKSLALYHLSYEGLVHEIMPVDQWNS